MPRLPAITLSVVSHGQNALVNALCADLRRIASCDLSVIITENVPEATALRPELRQTQIVANPTPAGFGVNHNAAFRLCSTPYFCVCNPDIRLPADPFPALLEALAPPAAAVAGPLVRTTDGRIEDSARRFPTAGILLRKLLRETRVPDYPVDCGALAVDWIAGMFMLFASEAYRTAGGFDERYFLYYEDVDLCRRLKNAGRQVVFQPGAEAIHDARRGSRRNPALALRHAVSAARFLLARASE